VSHTCWSQASGSGFPVPCLILSILQNPQAALRLPPPTPPHHNVLSSSVCPPLPITRTNSIRRHSSTPSLFTFKGLNSLFTGLSTNPSGFVWCGALCPLACSCYCHVISMTIVLCFFFPRDSVGLNLRGHFKPGKTFICVDLKEP
jgi:hypothetical protein